MSGRIDLPTIVQQVLIDTRGMEAGEKRAAVTGDRLTKTLKEQDKQSQDTSRSLDRVGKSADGAVLGFAQEAKAVEKSTTSHKRNNTELGKGQGLLRKFIGEAEKIKPEAVIGQVISGLKIPTIAGGISLISGAINALGATTFAFGAQLAPITGLAAALPGLGLAALSTAKGMQFLAGGAITASQAIAKYGPNSKQAQNAMRTLTPEAKTFAIQLGGVRKELQGIQEAGQKVALPGFTSALKTLRGLVPTLKTGFRELGQSLSDVAQGTAKAFTTGSFKNSLAQTLSNNARLVRVLGSALAPIAATFLNIMNAAAPLTLTLATWVKQAAQFGQAWTGANANRMSAFFERTKTITVELGHGIRDAGIAIKNMASIANKSIGIDFIKNIESGASKFRAFTETASGKNTIASYFADSGAIIHQFGLLVRDLGKAFIELGKNTSLSETIGKIRTDLLPAFVSLSSGVTTRLGPTLVNIATAFLKLSNVLSFSPLITVANSFATLAIGIAKVATKIPALGTIVATLLSVRLAMSAIGIAAEKAGIKTEVLTGKLIAEKTTALVTGTSNFILATRVEGLGKAMERTGVKAKILDVGLKTVGAGILALIGYFVTVGIQTAQLGKDWDTARAALSKNLIDPQATKDANSALDAMAKKVHDLKHPLTSGGGLLGGVSHVLSLAAEGWRGLLTGQNIFDQYDKATRQAAGDSTMALGAIFEAAMKVGTSQKDLAKAAQDAGLVLDGTYQENVKTLTTFYNTTVKANQATQDFYGAMVTFESGASTAAQKTDAFSKALSALNYALNPKASSQQAIAVASQQLADFNVNMQGAVVKVSKGSVTMDAFNAKNSTAITSLGQIAGTLQDVATKTFGETQSVDAATKAYGRQYDVLVNQVAKGLHITTAQAANLVNQYALTPTEVKTAISTPGLIDAIANTGDLKTAFDNLPKGVSIPVVVAYKVTGASQVTSILSELNKSGQVVRNIRLPGNASGGFIKGPGTATSDSIPVRLSNGEYVISAAIVKKFGKEFFDLLNAGKVTSKATGGLVDTITHTPAPKVTQHAAIPAPVVVAGGGSTKVQNNYITVYNPIREAAEDTITRRLRSIALEGHA